MSRYCRPKHIFLRMTLIFMLVALFVWSYYSFSQNYERVELSQKMVDALLDNKTELAREYAQQLGLVQKNLDQTESFLNDIKAENVKLKEKVKLLDQLSDMKRRIGALKDENARIKGMMEKEAKKDKQPAQTAAVHFDAIEKGRSLLAEFKQKIQDVKGRIHVLKKKEYKKKVALQEEIDRQESLLGNNGYVIKNGQPMAMTMPDPQKLRNDIKVKVEFVK